MIKQIAEAIREKRNYNRELLLEEMPDEIRKIGEGGYWHMHTINGDGTSWMRVSDVPANPTYIIVHMENGQNMHFDELDDDDFWRRYLIYCDNYSSIVFHVDTDDLMAYRSKVSYTPVTAEYDATNKTCIFRLGGILRFKSGVKYRITYSTY